MTLDVDLTQLPRPYRLAIELSKLGASRELIAACLGMEAEAAGPLVEIATAKEAAARRDEMDRLTPPWARRIDEIRKEQQRIEHAGDTGHGPTVH